MTAPKTITETNYSELELINRGKVRDIYRVGDKTLLLVTTDRLSAFDCILPTPIQSKGFVLTAISEFWFDFLRRITENRAHSCLAGRGQGGHTWSAAPAPLP